MDWNSNQWSTTGKPYNVNILICVLSVGIGAIPRASNIKHHTCDDKNPALTWKPPGSLPISILAFRVLILQTQYSQHMMTSSNGNIFRVTGHLCGEFTGRGEIPAQRPVTRIFDVFFDLRLNEWLSKQSWGWWFETPSCPLCRHSKEFLFSTLWRLGGSAN